MSRITDALMDLHAGEASLEEVECLFRRHRWVRERKTFDELMAEADAAAAAPVASFSDVENAYVDGILDLAQYRRLASVVSEVASTR